MTNCKEDPDKLYYSDKVEDIIKFYYCFDSIEELIEWMKSRPSAPINIVEKEGNSDIVFVIPTPNANDELTQNLSKSLNGFHQIFVESSGKYFNYAKSINRGVKEALKYNPKWIIVSNNDIIIKDDINKLYQKLMKIDNKKYKMIIRTDGTEMFELYRMNKLLNLAIFTKYKYVIKIFKKYNANYIASFHKIDYKIKILSSILYRPIIKIENLSFFGPFLILSPYYITEHNKKLFDENYINGIEDVELLLDIISNHSYTTIYFDLNHLDGKSLGKNIQRTIRNYLNMVYLNYKIKKGFINIKKIHISLRPI
ncbi:hypothetical protein YN1_6370 [Nanoarchaeota archaeon]